MWRETGPRGVCVFVKERERDECVCVYECVCVGGGVGWGLGMRMLSESFQVTLLGARQGLTDFWLCHLSLDCAR